MVTPKEYPKAGSLKLPVKLVTPINLRALSALADEDQFVNE